MKLLHLTFLFFICSCASQKAEKKEDYNVINQYFLHQSKPMNVYINSLSLIKKPEAIFNGYLGWKKKAKKSKYLYRNKEWLFNNKEIDEMKGIYKNWKKIKWNKKLIIYDNINFINFKDVDSLNKIRNVSKVTHDPIYKISYPFFNKKKTKAFIIVEKEYIIGGHGSTDMIVMKKKQKQWVFHGNAPF
ncbi:hypothetical protein DIS18_01420 [Algibacter marinivivus]|uniref:Uncharacterized protein n=1 Tax=Algibacter marinivivus TaxID=2100723 RepID=A0A2U2X628_9FLAO|nr:hypothetical protein [Algibacter marinivivus]PWH83239.1 hypothetical protein DIS18_01420 [Algibacter marinivivus]